MTHKKLIRINPKTYKPIKDRMYEDVMRMRIFKEESFKLCFKRDVSDKFFGMMEDLYKKDRIFRTNTILQLSGGTGSGKSLVGMTLAKKTCSNFKEENMKFYDQEIIESLDENIQDNIIVRDEATGKGVFGMGSTRIDGQMDVIADTTRKKGLSLIFIEPEEKLNKVAKWYLETVDMGSAIYKGKEIRVNRIGIKEPKTMFFIGSIYLHVLDEDDPGWMAYNKRKDEFIDSVLNNDFKGSKADFEQIALDILDEMDTDVYRTKNEQKLFVLKKYPNYTSGEIEMILSALKIAIREIGGGK